MSNWYFELQEVTDNFESYNGDTVEQTAEDFAGMNASFSIDNENPEVNHPDFIISSIDEAPTAVINGQPQTAQILGGTHPPKRKR